MSNRRAITAAVVVRVYICSKLTRARSSALGTSRAFCLSIQIQNLRIFTFSVTDSGELPVLLLYVYSSKHGCSRLYQRKLVRAKNDIAA